MTNYHYPAKIKNGPYSFWIGLLLMLGIGGAAIYGSVFAFRHILLEHKLSDKGQLTIAVVVEKEQIDSNTSPEADEGTLYILKYRFDTGSGQITGKSRVSKNTFSYTRKGANINVIYMPDNPEMNMPAGNELSNLFWIFAIFGLVIGLGASIVVIGMIIKRIRGDYGSL